jgi:stage III sporulation protein SpoIIIAA
MVQRKITDDLDALLQVLPPRVEEAVRAANHGDDLLEIVMDLGRVPEARFVDHELVLSPEEVTQEDLDHVIVRISEFTGDNRAGIERTLHRISAIRNRQGKVIGLTCRVGRAVYGVIEIVEDIMKSGHSILLLGRPGVGKTTLLREAARVLSEKRRVVVVDTSNEIGGDGDIPHPAIGRARRMQVADPALQHEVMIEAVENHMPQVIVIDEIGREQEATAARTIAERGVQLVGTAHGNSLENLLINPTLSDLVGGIESVTLSDEEARRRGTQKAVLERRAPPTFDVLIELQDRQRLAVHPSVAAAVDALLRGRMPQPEIRWVDEAGVVQVEAQVLPGAAMGNGDRGLGNGGAAFGSRGDWGLGTGGAAYGSRGAAGGSLAFGSREERETGMGRLPFERHAERTAERGLGTGERGLGDGVLPGAAVPAGAVTRQRPALRVYPYGVGRSRLVQAAQNLGVPLTVVDGLEQANAVVTLKNYYRKHPQPIAEAERRRVPVYVLRSNTVNQMEAILGDIFGVPVEYEDPMSRAVSETQEAIRRVLGGSAAEELPPAGPDVRRMQHEMARSANLVSHSYGSEPRRRVRIFQG